MEEQLHQNNCKICDKETDVTFVINEELVHICERCATTIFFQQSRMYAKSRSIYTIPLTYKHGNIRHPEIAKNVLNHLNELLGKEYRYSTGKENDVFLKLISARVNEGHTEKQLKAVSYHRHQLWRDDPMMSKFIRPATLFNREKFHSYIAELPEEINPENTKMQREIIRKLNSLALKGGATEETDRLAHELIDLGYNNEKYLSDFLL